MAAHDTIPVPAVDELVLVGRQPAVRPTATVELMGLALHPLSEAQVVQHIVGTTRSRLRPYAGANGYGSANGYRDGDANGNANGKGNGNGRPTSPGGWLLTANVDVLRQIHKSPELAQAAGQATVRVADGAPLVWASRLQGSPLPERVAGSSLIYPLADEAARHGVSVFLLGGNPGVAEAAATKLKQRAPDLSIIGTLCPEQGFERDPAQMAALVAALRAANPDIVVVGLSFAKQERLIAMLRRYMPETWFLGTGITLSFVAGEMSRAPEWMQRLGLEWAHRLAQEPRRLWRRYLVDDIPFAVRLLWHSWRRAARSA